MALEEITARILADARGEAERILAEARARAKEIKVRYAQQAEAESRRLLEEAERRAAEEKRRLTSIARLESRKAVLTEKQSLVDEVFERAQAELGSLPRDKYLAWMARHITEFVDSEHQELILSPSDRASIGQRLSAEVNDALKRQGKAGSVVLSEETRPIEAGFFLRAGEIEINGSLKTLISSVREEVEPEIIGILFGEG